MVASKSTILLAAERLSHDEACRLAKLAEASPAQTIVLDMSHSRDASTAGFARLVLLRRELIQNGRDLWLAGLQYRALRLFEVHRLEGVLPKLGDLPAASIPRRDSRRSPSQPPARSSRAVASSR